VLHGEDLKQEVSTRRQRESNRREGPSDVPHCASHGHRLYPMSIVLPDAILATDNEGDSRWVVRPARSDPAFDVTRKLLPEKKILGYQLRSRSEHRRSRRYRSAKRASAVRSTSGDDTVWSESPRGYLQAGEWRALVCGVHL
jgi:hypothetical protein